ncbi:MAG: ATPase domain-containing protein [Desulfurococcaceae archaeon]
MPSPRFTFGFIYFTQDLFKYILPNGIPRNSLVVLAGEGGSGKSVIMAHVVKDALSAEEPVIYVALDDDPQTVLSQLTAFKVNAEGLCNEKKLLIIDGFSYLVKPRKTSFCVEEEIQPDNPDSIISTLIKVTDKHRVENKGLIIIDSLNEVMVSLDPTRFISFIKSLRANFAKARGVLTFTTLHTSTPSFKEYLLSIEHLVDGIIETANIPGELAQQLPIFIRQITVRKMKGVNSKPGWVLYGIDNEGLKPVILKVTGSSK